MTESRLLLGIAAVFAGTTVLFTMFGIVYNPVLLLVAALFGVVTYILWTHGTGRLAARIYARVERQAANDAGGSRAGGRRRTRERVGRARAGDGGFGAGPREDWEPPGDRRTRNRRQTDQRRRRDRAPRSSDGPTEAEAYRRLGLDPGADQQAIKDAYREKVKTVHPDTEDGDQEQFKAVNAAYERLTEQ